MRYRGVPSREDKKESIASIKNDPVSDDKPSNKKKIMLRFIFGILMIMLFFGIVAAGHLYVWILVVMLQTIIFRELVTVRYKAAKEKDVPWFRSVQWSWFFVAIFYSYGDTLYSFLKNHEGPRLPKVLAVYLRYHSWISFSSYAILFVLSVLSLKKGLYKYQMGQFTWTILTLGWIVFQMKYVLNNILNGLFWFVFPVSLVVCNDCFAYFCGMLFGRKFIKFEFLKLSPNKTWEGYIGAFLVTCVFAFFCSQFLAQFQYFICPVRELSFSPQVLSCTPMEVFTVSNYAIPAELAKYSPIKEVQLMPIQVHALVFAIFASIIAPFGGFFASAVKRAYKLKDFDSLIPGHGGIMDRMDCQMITALFTSVYYTTFIRQGNHSVLMILSAIAKLPKEGQQEIFDKLRSMLESGN